MPLRSSIGDPSRPAMLAGGLVCLVSPSREVLVAKPRGKSGWSSSWEVKPVPLEGDAQGEPVLDHLPVEALFVLLRRGEQLGFKALGADGRTLQAVEALNEPHRIYNHNFGAWESWEERGGELVNSQWRHKKLGYKVRPVVAVPAEAFARIEVQHKREVMRLQKQLEKLGVRAVLPLQQESPSPSKEAREVESLRLQLAEVNRSLQHWQQEAAARQAALDEAQQQSQHMHTRQVGMGLPSQAATTIATLRADLREAQAQHAAQLAGLQAQHAQQLEALRQEHSEMLKGLLQQQRAHLAAAAAGGGGGREAGTAAAAEAAALQAQVEALQRQLQMAAAERDAAVGEVRAEMAAALHAKDEELHRLLMGKDAEVYWLLEERQRLDLALHTIKDMTAIVRQASPATTSAGLPSSGSGGSGITASGGMGGGGQEQQSRGPGQVQWPPQQQESGGSRGDFQLPPLLSPSLPNLGMSFDLGSRPASAPPSAAAGLPPVAVRSSAARDTTAVSRRAPEEQWCSGAVQRAQQQQEQGQQQRSLDGSGETPCSSQGGEGSAAAGPALQSGLSSGMLQPASPSAHSGQQQQQPAHIQPWEVQGAVDLGAALAAVDAAATVQRLPMPETARSVAAAGAGAQQQGGRVGAAGEAADGQPGNAPEAPAASKLRLSREGSGRLGVHQPPSQQQQQQQQRATGAAAGGGGGVQAVFNSDVRSRISSLYDMLNPFNPSSGDTPRSNEHNQQPREDDLIRVAHLSRLPPRPVGRQQEEDESSLGDSVHRVPIGGSYLVDYNGARPDSMTEEAMARILDGPLAPPREGEAGGTVARWRSGGGQGAGAGAGGGGHHAHHPPCSAPASVAGGEEVVEEEGLASPRPGAGGGWPSGSLSLPGSARATPLLAESERVWEAGQALGDLSKEQLAARRNRGAGAGGDFFPPTEAVKAMHERSPGGADAVAQLMADQLAMRASLPEGGWLGAGRRGPTNRRLDLLADGQGEGAPSKPAALHPLRKSAPAGPVQGASQQGGGGSRAQEGGRHPLRRSSFLTRLPVQMEAIWGE